MKLHPQEVLADNAKKAWSQNTHAQMELKFDSTWASFIEASTLSISSHFYWLQWNWIDFLSLSALIIQIECTASFTDTDLDCCICSVHSLQLGKDSNQIISASYILSLMVNLSVVMQVLTFFSSPYSSSQWWQRQSGWPAPAPRLEVWPSAVLQLLYHSLATVGPHQKTTWLPHVMWTVLWGPR